MTGARDPEADVATCEPCALREAGQEARAIEIEHVRSQRLALAVLNGAEDAQTEIATELSGCSDCLGRLVAIYLCNYTEALAHMAGDDRNAAAKWIERGLVADLDGQQE
jgi:hypothetical protein